MTMRRISLPPFQSVPAASTAGTAIIPQLPQHLVYDCIALKLPANTVASDITEVKIRLGGKTIVQASGTQLDTINKWYGLVNNASYLPIHFSDRTALTFGGQRLGALDTIKRKYSEFSIEVTLDGTQTGTTLSAIAFCGKDKPVFQGFDSSAMFRAIIKSTHAPSAAGTFDLPISVGSNGANLIRAIHFSHSYMTHLEIQKNGVSISDKLALADHDFYQDELLRDNQSGYFSWDAMATGNQMDAFSTVDANNVPAAMRWMATVSQADSIVALSDLFAADISTL